MTKPTASKSASVPAVLAWLERTGTEKNRDGMARYGIVAKKAFGVPVGVLRAYAKGLGQDHDLALALWSTGCYEARLLAAFVDEPTRVTGPQMNAWCKDFDNWAVCDTVCFHLFDRNPLAYAKVAAWAGRKPEFEKRAAFALLASLALHDKKAPDELFLPAFTLMEEASSDDRNFVKKAVSWALRGIGQRNAALHERALTLAKRLRDAENSTCRWVGRDALRDLDSEKVRARLRSKAARAKKVPAKKAPAKKRKHA